MTENYSSADSGGAVTPDANAPYPGTDVPQQPVHSASQGAALSGDQPASYGRHGVVSDTSTDSTSTSDVAKDEGRRLQGEASASAQQVSSTAKQEAGKVADEAKHQASNLWQQFQRDAGDQASHQQGRAAKSVREVSDDLAGIRRGEEPKGAVTRDLLSMADERVSAIADRLENSNPQDLIQDVRRFAARRPFTFLAIAAGVGLVAGRVTRGLTDSGDDSDSQGYSGTGTADYGYPVQGGYPTTGYAGQEHSAQAYQGQGYPTGGQYSAGQYSDTQYGQQQYGQQQAYGTGYDQSAGGYAAGEYGAGQGYEAGQQYPGTGEYNR